MATSRDHRLLDRVGEITNTLQIHVLGTALVRGTGNAISAPITARMCVVTKTDDLKDFHDGDILVIDRRPAPSSTRCAAPVPW
jgi:hypothetical protein